MKIILQQFAEVEEELKTLKATVNELVRRQRGAESVKLGRLPSGICFPLKNVADVCDIEVKFKSRDTYSQVVSVIFTWFCLDLFL